MDRKEFFTSLRNPLDNEDVIKRLVEAYASSSPKLPSEEFSASFYNNITESRRANEKNKNAICKRL